MNTLSIGSGGIKGFSYLGVCRFLEKREILKDVGLYVGCSVGSLICLSLICGRGVSDILKEFLNTGFEELVEGGSSFEEMVSKVGLFDKRRMREYILECVRKWLVIEVDEAETLTFGELRELTGKDFYVITANIDTYATKIYCPKITPDEPCVDAVVASCSIPFVIQGTEIPEGFLVDGALMDPIGLKVAFKYSTPGAKIYSCFFSFKPTSVSVLRSLQKDNYNPEIIEKFWDQADVSYPQPPEHTKATQSGLVTNLLSHGQRLYRSFMEALVDNYVHRHIFENRTLQTPFTLYLFPIPNFNANLVTSAEKKVEMYFTGQDLSEKIARGYDLI